MIVAQCAQVLENTCVPVCIVPVSRREVAVTLLSGQGAEGYAHGHSYVIWGQKWSMSTFLHVVVQPGMYFG